ncbi:MAG: trypsin-like peptidase domain-containing protein [Anaerolineales bacterium]|nr:trypsin-like peptidase domain-containing protein [Anaerolineales bacterium]MCB0005119.1 trypsin-like peptidase domain-containing protein [Anaerolineales bacterium]MCB0012324.1 trypsin-like peptidase domain-containing protein [Anaerolineales bacterium]MCB0027336.1 trypsin-like peptidase domain-containing protein [Anaerolineales bacterium]
MNLAKTRWWPLLLVLFLLPALACGIGGDEETPTPEPQVDNNTSTDNNQGNTENNTQPDPTKAPEPTPTEVSLAVNSLEGVQSAVVQIVAQGSFVDPEFGLMLNAAGSGSGFIIDPSGIAVTNNHVVTGAAFLEVYIQGEDRPRNARVLGVSECSDLAVIDIDGDGFPYLEWYGDPINVGLDIYTAGFPLGDPEFTLTRGIVSKAQASGETNWASVDNVIEHDATINPGNSGGPLVTVDGRVVGVNYAGASSTSQYFAIARNEALPVIDQLRNEQDVTSIGVNGQAVSDGQSIYGIWVSSVESGSAADNAGVQAGDIILSLEGLVLATDGTMADYCDILRSHRPGDVMSIEVLRFATEEVLEGQLNGTTLEQSFSFAVAEGDTVDQSSQNGGGSANYADYMTIVDNSGLLSVSVPTAWGDVDGSPWVVDGEQLGLRLVAAPNIDDFYSVWNVPGMIFTASIDLAALTDDEILDLVTWDSCDFSGRFDYSDPLYTGKYDVWENCGDVGATYITLSVSPDGRAFSILVEIQVVTQADLEALDTIVNTFQVDVE